MVTEVDYASERLVIDAIRERYPDDAILAEESGHHAKAAVRRRSQRANLGRGSAGRDGELREWDSVLLRLGGDGRWGRPAVGVIHDPMRDDCYVATADGPATLNGEPVRASDKDALGDFVVSLAIIGRGGIGRERRIGREIRIPRRMGSAALSLAYVADGRFDAFVQNGGLSLWDVAAAGLIAERAGATVTRPRRWAWWDRAARAPR